MAGVAPDRGISTRNVLEAYTLPPRSTKSVNICLRSSSVRPSSELANFANCSTARNPVPYVPQHVFAYIYLGLGDTESALRFLIKACEEREAWLIFLTTDPVYEANRHHSGNFVR